MTTTTLKALVALSPGDLFKFRGKEYLFVSHGRGTKEHIADPATGKRYTLTRTAQVEPTGHDTDALGKILAEAAAKAPSLPPGTKVRIVDNQRTRAKGIAGVESVIVRTNAKSYSLANDWRVGPDLVEEI